eukprot:4679953-Prymnesium_polylepis.1
MRPLDGELVRHELRERALGWRARARADCFLRRHRLLSFCEALRRAMLRRHFRSQQSSRVEDGRARRCVGGGVLLVALLIELPLAASQAHLDAPQLRL